MLRILFALILGFASSPTLWSQCDQGTCPLDMEAKVGGNTTPDGTPVQCDLPPVLRRHNISSRGSGCCVFTSIHHSACWHHVPQLFEMHKWVQSKGLPGGGYPGNVDDRIRMICKERNAPVPPYVQIESGDTAILKLALKNGFLPAITYSYSPTGRYGGRKIAHMVSLVHADAKGNFGILDNNYETELEWLNETEFRRSYTGGGGRGWAVVFLLPGPPPPPKNNIVI